MIDLRAEIVEALRSPDVVEVLIEIVRTSVRGELDRVLRDELVDAKEAARILSMTEGAVRKAAARGSIPCRRIDRRLRFRRSELLALGSEAPSRCVEVEPSSRHGSAPSSR